MSDFERRDFLKGAAAFAALNSTQQAEAGDPSFMSDAPDPLFAGKELPSFKFALENSKGRVIGGNTAKEATVTQFPISKDIAGVSMGLAPGGIRELHWHPTADEWQYVLEGKISMPLFGSHGRFATQTLEQGDVGYIPQGYGHSIENVGDRKARVLIGFNSGVYEEIDLSEWIAGNPVDEPASNFGKPASLFQNFPRRDVFITESGAQK
jgi:oxalate decarboxylase